MPMVGGGGGEGVSRKAFPQRNSDSNSRVAGGGKREIAKKRNGQTEFMRRRNRVPACTYITGSVVDPDLGSDPVGSASL
jgi:hypothetical protein